MTVRQMRANRRNARKSTGPRTDEGRKQSSQNAITHGVFCRNVVLPGESRSAFNAMRQAFIKDIGPQNLTQLLLVERIAANTWKCDRLDEAELKAYELRRSAHACGLEDSLTGEKESDSFRVNAFWEKIQGKYADGQDLSNDPQYLQICSAMGSAAMTMNSLMGDEKPELERIQMMRMRLESSTHRAFRELRLLQAESKKDGTFGPSPFCQEDVTAMRKLARQLDLKLMEDSLDEDEEVEEEIESEDADQDAEESSDAAQADSPTRERGVPDEDQTAQNEPNSEKPLATPEHDEACDDPSAQESAQMSELAAVQEETIRQVQDDIAAKLRREMDES